MSYAGYLIKVGTYTIPLNMIRAETYEVTKNEQDLDSYADMNGDLHRHSINWKMKAEFELIPLLTNTQFSEIMSNIQSQYIDAQEKSANVTFYVPELDEYVTQKSYLPSVTMPIYLASATEIKYNPIRLAFIAY